MAPTRLVTVWAREVRFGRFPIFFIFVLVDGICEVYRKSFSLIGVK